MHRVLVGAVAMLAGCTGMWGPGDGGEHVQTEAPGPVVAGGPSQGAALSAGQEQRFELVGNGTMLVHVEVQRTSTEPTRLSVEVQESGSAGGAQEAFFLNAIAGQGEVRTSSFVVDLQEDAILLAQGMEGEAEIRVSMQRAALPDEGYPTSPTGAATETPAPAGASTWSETPAETGSPSSG